MQLSLELFNFYPCPVCADKCEIKLSKKEKPYYQCEACGVQVFIRSREGIALFEEIRAGNDLNKLVNSDDSILNSKVIKNRARIYLINSQIKKLKDKELFTSPETKTKITELNIKISQLENESIQLLTKQ